MPDIRELRRALSRRLRQPRAEADGSFLPAGPDRRPPEDSFLPPPGGHRPPAGRPAPAAPPPRGVRADAGGELVTGWGACRLMAPAVESAAVAAAYRAATGTGQLAVLLAVPAEQVVFLDLETCGLRNEPLFLCGLATVGEQAVECRLLLARTLREEAAVIAAAAERLAGAGALVTFNGASFDLPFLLRRAAYFGLPVPLPELRVDLLHLARRRFGRRFGDCRLQTLESAVCGRPRAGDDIPGAEIPGVYARYAESGDEALIAPILEHNVLDLVTMVDLVAHL